MAGTDKAWEDIGKTDPYWGVVTSPRFKREQLDEQARAEFFASGERDLTKVLGDIQRHLDPQFSPKRCLDFGCGVGRIVIPMAQRYPSVVGVDVSISMIAEARHNCEGLGISNVTFARSDDTLSQVQGTFDFIHTFIVLQHIAPRRGERLVQALVKRLAVGGVAALHVTYSHRDVTLLRRMKLWVWTYAPLAGQAIRAVRGQGIRTGLEMRMQMNYYSLNWLFRLLQLEGFQTLHMHFTDHGGYLGVMFLIQRTAPSPVSS